MPSSDLTDSIAGAVATYQRTADLGVLIDRLRTLSDEADLEALKAGAEPFRNNPEVVIPIYETVVRRSPRDARAMVVLANAYWLTGRGPDLVGELARRAIDADGTNRGAWHLWALSESNVRDRMDRWQTVAKRFPQDQLARAALADNATSVADAEHDPIALDLAITTYEGLLAESINPEQSRALVETLEKLRKWRF